MSVGSLPRAAALPLVALGLGGCVYYNSIYNAQRAYQEGERHRRMGDDEYAATAYRDVTRKAAEAYRRDPTGEWADDALLLLGSARLRLGELRAGRAALREAAESADDERTRLEALVYLAAALAEAGHRDEAMPLLNEALEGLDSGSALAEGHLRRGRLLLADGSVLAGWWDLDRAAATDPGLRFEAALESLRWAVDLNDRDRARDSMRRLFRYPEGAARLQTIVGLVRKGSERWGAGAAADLLLAADSARWGGAARGRVRLERARLLREADREQEALELARSIARGFGPESAEARVQLVRWRLAAAQDLADVEEAAQLLRPAADQAPVAELLADLNELSRLTAIGLQDPLGLFAAAELARLRLGAPTLARGLYLAYADGSPDDPWTPKALLAALAVSSAEGDRAWIRGRLEARANSPYAQAARGDEAPGLGALEEELERRIEGMGAR